MKLTKVLTVAAFALAMSIAVAMAQDKPKEIKKGGCCDKAGGADKCDHKCCKEASAKKEICAKCNAPKK
jgi:hypothetical protein